MVFVGTLRSLVRCGALLAFIVAIGDVRGERVPTFECVSVMAPFHELLKVIGIGVARAKLIAAARFSPYRDDEDFKARFSASGGAGKWHSVQQLLDSKELCIGKSTAGSTCLDVNAANKWKLAELEGIDDATAAKIVADRMHGFRDEADMKSRIEAQKRLNGRYHWPAIQKLLHDPMGLCFTPYVGPSDDDVRGDEATTPAPPQQEYSTPPPTTASTSKKPTAVLTTAEAPRKSAEVPEEEKSRPAVPTTATTTAKASPPAPVLVTTTAGTPTAPPQQPVEERPTPAAPTTTPTPLPVTTTTASTPAPVPATTAAEPSTPAPLPVTTTTKSSTPAPVPATTTGEAPTEAPQGPHSQPPHEAEALTTATLGPALDKAPVVVQGLPQEWYAKPEGQLSWDPAKSELVLRVQVTAGAPVKTQGYKLFFGPQDLQIQGENFRWKCRHYANLVLVGVLSPDHHKVVSVKGVSAASGHSSSGSAHPAQANTEKAKPHAPQAEAVTTAAVTTATLGPALDKVPVVVKGLPREWYAKPEGQLSWDPAKSELILNLQVTDGAPVRHQGYKLIFRPEDLGVEGEKFQWKCRHYQFVLLGVLSPDHRKVVNVKGVPAASRHSPPGPARPAQANTGEVRRHAPQVAASLPQMLGAMLNNVVIQFRGAPPQWNLKPQGQLTWDPAKPQLSLFIQSTDAAPSSIKGSRYYFKLDGCRVQGESFEWRCYHSPSLVIVGTLTPDHSKITGAMAVIQR